MQTVPFVVETITPTVPPILLPTSTPELQPTVTSTNTPEATPTVQVQVESSKNTYSFVALLDYNKHVMEVEESIQYTNSTGQEISEILLIVPPNQETEVLTLNTVSVENQSAVTNYSLEGITLSVLLESPLKNGNTVSIQISYTLNLKSSSGVLGYTSRQTNLSDWYPFVAPYDQENGWIINQPADVGEYLVYDLADFDVTLALTGPKGLLVAASTIAEPVEENIYKMTALNSRNITFSVSDQYVQLNKGFSDTVVNAYVFAEDEEAGWAAVENSGRAILLFSTLYGVPYPHGTLNIVESDFSDGMEYDGLYYLSQDYFERYDGSFMNYLSLLSVHETAHQWWFGVVANDQANEPWLDESLATYSEYLFVEQYYPDLLDWWWQYRVDYYSPSGKVDMTIYDQDELRPYINAVYLRGATFLHQLRQSIGDDAFFSDLILYAKTFRGQIVKSSDFFAVFIPSSTNETTTLLQKYFK